MCVCVCVWVICLCVHNKDKAFCVVLMYTCLALIVLQMNTEQQCLTDGNYNNFNVQVNVRFTTFA